MNQTIKRILLPLGLLGAASAILLLSDLNSRVGARSSARPARIPVAILKHASNLLLDEVENGVLDKLASEGYQDGGRITLQRFCAEGDLPTANTIAKRITDGSFKMVITISTLSLQAVAGANREGRAIHVFGAVTDPAGAGVGIERMNSTNKPPWMAGIGTFQPVELTFREAKRLWPDLKVVGVVWNPAERNSEACVLKARDVCRELNLQLMEASVDQAKDVRESAESLVARGAQALWTGFDVTSLNASAALCETAHRAKIPTFSNTSGHVRHGTLFDLGANYFEVGQKIGSIASAVLGGLNSASVVISNFMPERVMLNKQTLQGLRDPWRFSDDLIARAELIIGKDGRVEKDASKSPASAPKIPALLDGRQFSIGIAYFAPEEGVESAMAGLFDGLREHGIIEGKNLVVRKTHANGEISGIPAILQSLDASDVDVIVTFSTPVLTASCAMVRRKPVVFTYVSDPVAAGAGESMETHLPFVTGIGSFPPVREGVEFLKLTVPQLKQLGAIYNNAEANSVKVVSVLRDLCRQEGIELIEAVANGTSEVVPAIQSLAARQVQAVYLPSDNTAYQAFDGLIDTLNKARIPLVIDAPEFAQRGALAVVGIGYYASGFAAANPLLRVLAGESPAKIPMKDVADKQIILNQEAARKLGIIFPPAALKMQTPQAKSIPPPKTAIGKLWRIQQIVYLESPMIEDAMRGLKDGLKEADLVEGTHYTLKTLSAQGDMASLGSLFDAAKTAGADLYMLYSTPTLQTALKKVQDTPVVFTVVADPFVAGAGKSDQDHLPNFTGVYTVGPYREMAEFLRDCFPNFKRIGTLFCPAEVNSVANKDLFVREAARCGLTVETVPANSAAELPDAAVALCSRRIDVVMQVIDNMSAVGFPSIARATAQAHIPLFACQDSAAKQGAAIVLSRDYYEAGRETAQKIALIMRGTSPAQIPFSPPRTIKKLVNLKSARENNLQIPESFLRDAKTIPGNTQP